MPSLTIRDLLADPAYKKYFVRVPKLPSHYTPDSLPWKLMILKRGETSWRSKRFGTYPEAFAALKKLLPKIQDGVINSPGVNFMPPVNVMKIKGRVHESGPLKGQPILVNKLWDWKPMLDGDMETHHWCPYCRRPTVFKYYRQHQAMTKSRVGIIGTLLDPSLLRCSICGASERVVPLRHPEDNQKWDVRRPRVASNR